MSRGQIDQVMSTLIVFIVVFFIMGLFTAFAAGIGSFKGVRDSFFSETVSYKNTVQLGESQALSDIFLSDSLDGKSVAEHIGSLATLTKDEALETIPSIRSLFDSSYSCNGMNSLFVIRYASCSGPCFISYIDYPASENSLQPFDEYALGYSEADAAFPDNPEGVDQGYYGLGIGDVRVVIKGDVVC